MSQPNESKSFLDAKTILAFALTVAFFFGWNWFMEKRFPKPPPAAQAAANATAAQDANAAARANGQPVVGEPAASLAPGRDAKGANAATAQAATGAPAAERLIAYDSADLGFQLSSHGMGLKSIDVKTYKTRSGEPIILGAVNASLPFATELVETGAPIDFTVEKSGDSEFIGRATVGGMEITKTIKANPGTYSLDVAVAVKNPSAGFKGLQTTLSDALVETKSAGFLMPSTERQDFFFHHDGKTTRTALNKEKGGAVAEKNVNLLALSTHYFAMAIVDSKTLVPRFEGKAVPGGAEAVGKLIYEPINRSEPFEIRYKAYAGPKSFEAMDRVDPELASVIDYGMFGVLGKPLWQLLKFCYSLIQNYGVAIILMTLVVRLCVLPFNMYSFRSMKAMQRIQPEINVLKERYKADPRTMNAEVMSLMKANKANPLGGCIPILLQLPIFFALYQVLGQSIELYRAPFMLWIQDLSASDRFYVLPVLMAGAMFMQQKLTPTAMDPAQAKVMMWMPLIFAFFMLGLPSGLTLYILVSTLFGIGQQLLFARDRRATAGALGGKNQPVKA